MNYSIGAVDAHRRLARLGSSRIMVPTWGGPCRAFISAIRPGDSHASRANQRFANDWPQPIVNIRWLT